MFLNLINPKTTLNPSHPSLAFLINIVYYFAMLYIVSMFNTCIENLQY